MAHDPSEYDELFRPQIQGRSRHGYRYDRPAGRRSLLAQLRRIAQRGKGPKRGAGRTRYDVGQTPASSRRCVVKSRYVKTDAAGREASRQHMDYLERDGVERDGSPGRFYGAGENLDRAAWEAPLAGEKRQFRLIVSPEDGAQIDLRALVRELLAQMEKDLGHPLLWAAVNHYNTEHPHAHVVIRGVDAEGRGLFIPERYIQEHMRARAEQQLTRELGPRNERDIAEQRSREIEQERFTSLDRTIEKLVGGGGLAVDPSAVAKLPAPIRTAVLARLATLGRLGLATRFPSGRWQLGQTWKADLLQLGTRGDIIKRLHQVTPTDPARYRIAEPGDLPAPVEGVVRAKALHDELTGELFAAVETLRGEVHYVRLPKDAADFVGAGDIVKIGRTTESWIKPTDRVLVAVAERNGGVYDPVAHVHQLESAYRSGTSPPDLVAGNLQRLERLERYGLASRLPDRTWQVPLDLLAQLQAREATHPRHALLVQYLGAPLHVQARYPGPTWLDRQQTTGLDGGSRFAAELAAAIHERAVYLMSFGLDRHSPDKERRLEATERMLFGRRRAAEVRASFDDTPGTFRGKLVTHPPLPSGRAYAEVVDGRTNRLVLLPWSGDVRRFEGREVEVVMDQAKRVTVRPPRRLGRGEE